MKIEQVAVTALIPYAKNSRTHDDAQVAQIAASIKEFGWTNPILVDGDKGIIAGHGRLMAARKLGMTEVPVIELNDLTPTQKKAYIIADNRLALNAGWDDQLLTIELNELLADKFSLDLLGFNADELNALLNPVEINEGLVDEDEVPEPPPEPITKLGDVWLLGNHRLMCEIAQALTLWKNLLITLRLIFVTPIRHTVSMRKAIDRKEKGQNLYLMAFNIKILKMIRLITLLRRIKLWKAFYRFHGKFGGVLTIIAMRCHSLTIGLYGISELKINKKTHNQTVSWLGLNQPGHLFAYLDICGKV